MGKYVSSLAVMAAASLAHAGPTALLVMPIADILGHREAYYTYGITGNERNVDRAYYHDHGAEFGLFNRAEIGFDNDFRGNTVWNAKVQVLNDPKKDKYAFSLGLMGYNDMNTEGNWYAVGRYNFKDFRCHLGYAQNGDNSLMVGFDGPVFGDATWQAETNVAQTYRTWISLNFNVHELKGLSLMVGVGLPKEKSDGIQHQIIATYAFKF